MAKVTGIGGVFFKAKDPKGLAKWYAEHLGMSLEEWGGVVFHWKADQEAQSASGATVWHLADEDGDWFKPSESRVMINYRVDDLDGLLAQLNGAGIETLKGPDDEFNGRFAWVMDPEGNKVELLAAEGPVGLTRLDRIDGPNYQGAQGVKTMRDCLNIIAVGALLVGCGEPSSSGFVTINLTDTAATDPMAIVSGYFAPRPLSELDDLSAIGGCTELDASEDCRAIRCNAGAMGDPSQSAGTLSVTVGSESPVDVTLDNSYRDTTTIGGIVPGQVVRVSASGGLVEAFEAEVPIPAAVTPTLPDSVSTGGPLEVSWPSASDADEVFVVITRDRTLITCQVSAANDSVTIPQRLLGLFESGAGIIAASSSNVVEVTSGDHAVEVRASHAVAGNTIMVD